VGERLIARKLPQMSDVERGAAERLLQKVKSGRMDEFI
jgi:2-iminoacetate synthase